MKTLAIAALLLLPVMGFAVPAPVDDRPVVTIEEYSPASSSFACILGNPHIPPGWGVLVSSSASRSYAVLIDPADCPTCDLGFTFSRVRMLLHLEPGATLRVSAAIADVIDDGGGCYRPGLQQATSGWTEVSGITAIGSYAISANWAAPCIETGRPYFLIFTTSNIGTGFVGPVLDGNGILNCHSYFAFFGGVWTDMGTFGLQGDPYIFAETDCCEAPVGLENASWGSAKSLFR
ncbi:MAG: hypothetical protein IPK20_00235 [Betaproteobacteria bacterium]|nr:hypothetical protein [Betaproteobacteria bacterium]